MSLEVTLRLNILFPAVCYTNMTSVWTPYTSATLGDIWCNFDSGWWCTGGAQCNVKGCATLVFTIWA